MSSLYIYIHIYIYIYKRVLTSDGDKQCDWLDFKFLSNGISYCLWDTLLITLSNIACKIQIRTPGFIFLSLSYTRYHDGDVMHQISFSQNDTVTIWFLYSESILGGSFCEVITCNTIKFALLQSIVHMVRQWLRQNMHQRLYSQNTYLALTGELCGFYCAVLGESWPRINGTAL